MGTKDRYALRATRSRTRRVEGLGRRLLRVGLADVLGHVNHDGTPTQVPGEAAGNGSTWDPADQDDRPRYRHVLPVTPRRRSCCPWAPCRCTRGIAVLGHLLHVADTLTGVRVFRVRDVLGVPGRRLDAVPPWASAGTRTLGRRPTGGYTPDGYDVVRRQLLSLQVPSARKTARLRYSSLSVGHITEQLSLVAGEYRRVNTGSARLVRYSRDRAAGLR